MCISKAGFGITGYCAAGLRSTLFPGGESLKPNLIDIEELQKIQAQKC